MVSRTRGRKRYGNMVVAISSVAIMLMLSGCLDEQMMHQVASDVIEPELSVETTEHMLMVDAFDRESGVMQVSISINETVVATYAEGFRHILRDLSDLPPGTHQIMVQATDSAGNRTSQAVSYGFEPYEIDRTLIDRRIIPVFGSYGLHVADLEVVHQRSQFTPRLTAPERRDELSEILILHNRLSLTLFHTSVQVEAQDVMGVPILDQQFMLGTLAAGRSSQALVRLVDMEFPVRYSVSISYQW